MKIVVVQYPDTTDISSIQKGQPATVNTVAGGVVLNASEWYEAPVAPVGPHTHPVVGATGQPVP